MFCSIIKVKILKIVFSYTLHTLPLFYMSVLREIRTVLKGRNPGLHTSSLAVINIMDLRLTNQGLPVGWTMYQLCDLIKFTPCKLLPDRPRRSPTASDFSFLIFKMMDLNQIVHFQFPDSSKKCSSGF